ncbi:MAG: hypothetical protein LC647_00770 [Beggiatoa sp.]|nr:hypothetical protein [Beggiatoa sp.]
MSFRQIVGFDFGHGESAFCVTPSVRHPRPDPVKLLGSTSFITVVGENEAGETVIGPDAKLPGVLNVRVRFKSQRFDDPDVAEPIRRFVSRAVRHLVEQQRYDLGDTLFVVGRPSSRGWKGMAPRYEALFRDCGLPNVQLIPESRAAFLSTNERESLKADDLRGLVLIVDMGSSTTDFTLVEDMKEMELQDFGNDQLGAGLIDREIMEAAISASPDVEGIRALFSGDPALRAQKELDVRKFKEEYFSREATHSATGLPVMIPLATQPKIVFLAFTLNEPLMDSILSRPLKELGGKGWRAAYEREIQAIKSKLGSRKIDIVIMTGAASQMRFTQEVVKRLLSPKHLVIGTAPELAIARGLAMAGSIDLQTSGFRAGVADFVRSGKIHEVVQKRLPDLREKIADVIVNKILEDVVPAAFKHWQRREKGLVRLVDLEPYAKMQMENWTRSDDGRKQTGEQIRLWSQLVLNDLVTELDALCDKHGIPRSQLRLELSPQEAKGEAILPALDPEEFLGYEAFANVLTVIMVIVIAIISGGTGMALIISGPIGWIAGALLGILAVARLRSWAEDTIKTSDLWMWVRESVSESQLRDTLREKRYETKARLVADLDKQDFSAATQQIEQQIERRLITAAEDVERVIR